VAANKLDKSKKGGQLTGEEEMQRLTGMDLILPARREISAYSTEHSGPGH